MLTSPLATENTGGITRVAIFALRWLMFIAALSIILELAAVTVLERFQLVLPPHERRAACTECMSAARLFEASAALAADAEVAKYLMEHQSSSVRRPTLAEVFDAATRKNVAREAHQRACEGKGVPDGCAAGKTKNKTALQRLLVRSDAFFSGALQRGWALYLHRNPTVASSELPVTTEDMIVKTGSLLDPLLGGVCGTACNPSTLLELAVSLWGVTGDPDVSHLVDTFVELWGAVAVVLFTGTFMGLTVVMRAHQVVHQQQLYERLLRQFRKRALQRSPPVMVDASTSTTAPAGGSRRPRESER